jgi:hypothetical protein
MSGRSASERAASAHRQNRRRRLIAIGQWQTPLVDAEPVRERVRALRDTGLSIAALRRQLNLPDQAFTHLVYSSPPSQKVLRETAEAVMAFWPTLQDFPDSASIDVTGSRRRVQALATRGWSKTRLAIELGMSEPNFKTCLRGQRVSARFARRVAAMYDRLWNERPEDHGVLGWVADRVRQSAAGDGFPGPLAWDDDTIDDPQAVPVTDAVEPVATDGGNVAARWLMGESVILGAEDRKEVLAHLYEWTNHTNAEIAEQLGMTPGAAEQQWNRMKRQARTEGRQLWRRVYVPRERNLKQNEMEEAV